MGKEIERKFLFVGTDPIESDLKLSRQGYFMINKFRHVRIRISDYRATLGLKVMHGKLREEFETVIPLQEGKEIYCLCQNTLEKKRFSFTLHGYHCDVDIYPNGLKIVEVEFKDMEQCTNFDTFLRGIVAQCFFGKEITGLKKYSNIEIAKKNLKF